eukprot:5804173-Heterocapsa_arctica.AAC.1
MSHTTWSAASSRDTSSGTLATLLERCRHVPLAVPDAGQVEQRADERGQEGMVIRAKEGPMRFTTTSM